MKNILSFYLSSREYTAWFIWEGNLEYICRPDVAFNDNKILVDAFKSANGEVTVMPLKRRV
jgi:hypothetical protein